MKNKINYKLVNIAVLALIIYLIYQTGNLWIGILAKVWKLLFPFMAGFIIAYALYPCLEYLTKHKIPKSVAMFIIVAVVLGLLAFANFLIVPRIFGEVPNLVNGIISFIKEISIKFDIDVSPIQDSLSTTFNEIVLSIGKYVSNGAINVISVSVGYMSTALITGTTTLYFLADMQKIRKSVKKYLQKKSKKMYRYVVLLDRDMKNYLTGFCRIILISLIEYTLAYTLIGHPYALVLGFLAMVANLIPYFGGIITNTIAAVTAFVINFKLFVITIITFVILSAVDGYVINPIVYGKTNEVPPIVVIMSVFAGGILFGILGILISLPLAIILITTIKYFKEDISEKIEDIKGEIKK